MQIAQNYSAQHSLLGSPISVYIQFCWPSIVLFFLQGEQRGSSLYKEEPCPTATTLKLLKDTHFKEMDRKSEVQHLKAAYSRIRARTAEHPAR